MPKGGERVGPELVVGAIVKPGLCVVGTPTPLIEPELGVKEQSGTVQQGFEGSLSRRHSAGRFGYFGHLKY